MCNTEKFTATDIDNLVKEGKSAAEIVEHLVNQGATNARVVENGFYPVGIQVCNHRVIYPPDLQPK